MDFILIMMVVAVGAMFFLSSRTRKQQRQAGEFRSSLEVGDQVMTGSGLFGTVVDVDGDVITLESPSGGRTDWLRGAISKLATPPYAEDEEYAEDEYDDDDSMEGDDADDVLVIEASGEAIDDATDDVETPGTEGPGLDPSDPRAGSAEDTRRP